MKKVKISEICTFLPKSQIKASEGKKEGKYVFFTSSDTKTLKIDDHLFDDEVVILGTGGKPSCNYYNGKFAVSTDNFVLKSNSISIKYLYYFLRHNSFEILENGFHGAGLKHISKDYVCNILVPLIDRNSQNKIIKNLDLINQEIKYLEKLILKIDEIVKSQFIEMFASSKEMKVEEVCSSFKIGPFGSALHKNEISNSGYAFVLGTDNAVKNEFAFKEIRYINEEKFKQLEKYTVNKDDIIMSMMGTVGRVALIPEELGRAIISSHLCILKVNKNLMYPEFFHIAFSQDDDIQQQIEGIHNGSIMKGFNLKIVKSFKVKCPSLPEQLHFINFKKQIDKSKFIIQKQIKLLEELLEKKMNEYFGE